MINCFCYYVLQVFRQKLIIWFIWIIWIVLSLNLGCYSQNLLEIRLIELVNLESEHESLYKISNGIIYSVHEDSMLVFRQF